MRRFLLAPIAVLLSVAFGAIPGVAAGPPAPSSVTIGHSAPDSLDPSVTAPGAGWDIVNQLFAGLTRWDQRAQTLSLDLAAGESASTDLKTWTFSLAAGAHWSNGRPITADDEVFAVKRELDPSGPALPAYRPFFSALIAGVTALDRRTVQFQLTRPAAYFPAVLSMPMMRPLPQATVVADGASWTDPGNIVVSGGYTLASNTASSIVLKANRLSRVRPAIDHVVYQLGSAPDLTAAFAAGSLDFLDSYLIGGPVGVDTAGLTSSLVVGGSLAVTEFLVFNAAYGPTTDANVRRALSAATDRAGLSNAAEAGNYATSTVTPPGIFGAAPASAGFGYDPDAARTYAAAAGGAFPSSITVSYPCGSQFRLRESAFLKQNWESVFGAGFTVSLTCGSANQVIGSLTAPDASQQAPVTIIAWAADYPDANNFLADNTTIRDRWSDARYDAALADGAGTLDAAARNAAYVNAETIINREVAAEAPVLNRPDAYLKKPSLTVVGDRVENWRTA